MHTYLKHSDTHYTIGMWQLNSATERVEFWKMFDVEEWKDAVAAVNILNGGTGIWNTAAFFPFKEY